MKFPYNCVNLRFDSIKYGSIKINGIDLSKIANEALVKNVVLIPEENLLFKGSLEYNIDPSGSLTRDRIIDFLQDCRVYDLFFTQMNFPSAFESRNKKRKNKGTKGRNASVKVSNHYKLYLIAD